MVELPGQRMHVSKRCRCFDHYLRENFGNGVGDAGKLLVTPDIVIVAIELGQEKASGGVVALVMEKIGVGRLESTCLKVLSSGVGSCQRRVQCTLYSQLRYLL